MYKVIIQKYEKVLDKDIPCNNKINKTPSLYIALYFEIYTSYVLLIILDYYL